MEHQSIKAIYMDVSLVTSQLKLKKIRRSLDSMKTMNDNLLKQEERKVKKWLKKHAQVSPSGSYKSLCKPLSSYPESSQDTDTRPVSGKESLEIPWSQFGDHLSNFVSFLRLPTKRPNDDRKHSKDLTPFSRTDMPLHTLAGPNANSSRNSSYNVFPPNRDSRKGSHSRQPSLDNTTSLQEAVALFPSLQRLSTKIERLSLSKLQLHSPVSGFPTLQKKLKGMIEKAKEEDKLRSLEPLPQIKPEEILSCRYLRLSQSNISTLLELCKESGIYIDLHPHMKESDIDASTILSSSPSKTT
ncbi:uncharacterized protein C16orf78 homolog isoform X2 [Hemicordylus capensis]|uniref:uncharacterized protein C16orf78 homolog isoform X2 n=1 Tax=Hemicordylus capensis TaxID=884348 RepID=UPI002304CC0B|nr:uncharacterized protein C16orf78 homolog isoform X2 [Hemicordylus capensis]